MSSHSLRSIRAGSSPPVEQCQPGDDQGPQENILFNFHLSSSRYSGYLSRDEALQLLKVGIVWQRRRFARLGHRLVDSSRASGGLQLMVTEFVCVVETVELCRLLVFHGVGIRILHALGGPRQDIVLVQFLAILLRVGGQLVNRLSEDGEANARLHLLHSQFTLQAFLFSRNLPELDEEACKLPHLLHHALPYCHLFQSLALS